MIQIRLWNTKNELTDGLLICTLKIKVLRNQGLENSRFISNPRKSLGLATLK